MDIPQNRRQVTGRLCGTCVAAALLFIACLPTPVAADDMAAPRLVGSEASGLNLTPPQQQKMAAVESASRAQSQQLIAQIQKLRRALSEIYEAYSVDVAGARKKNQELNRVQGQLLDLRLSQQLQLRKILSADQFAQLQAVIRRHEAAEEDRRDPDDPHERRHRDSR